jgi:thiol-disulfide isomerase/thioredoxin
MTHSPLPRRPRRRPGARLPRAILAIAAAAAAAAVLGTFAALPARAQRAPADNVLRDFQRIGDYVLAVDGKLVPAEIYQSQRAAAILILSSSLPSPVLLSPSTGLAETLNLMKLNKKPDGTIDVLSDAALAAQGPIDIQEEEIRFKADGHSGELKTAPPLLGPRRIDEVTAHNPEYLPRAASYGLNPQAVAALKKEQRPVTVRIFYGSWCPHCREMVPHAIRLQQALRGARIHFEYFGLPPRFGTDPPAQQNGIKGVPTAIVFVSGREVGRITGNGWTAPESALVAILSGKATPESG